MTFSYDNMNPFISIVIRTYNSAAFVEHAIKSVFNQTIDPKWYEIVLIDDGSQDATIDILKKYKNRIRLIQITHGEQVRALNIGIRHAKGKYLIILDADDTFEPTALLEMERIVRKYPEIGFVYCDYYEKSLETGNQKIVSLKENIFNSVAEGILFRRDIFEEIGLYDENLILPEYDILIKIRQKYKGMYIAKPLFTYNRREASLSANKEYIARGKRELAEKYADREEIKNIRDY